jgi:hypothetical protein
MQYLTHANTGCQVTLELGELRATAAMHKNMADIAAHQAMAVLQASRDERSQLAETERESLRQAVRDLSERTDEQNIIGKLHHSLLSSRMGERSASRKLGASRADGLRLQAEVMKLEGLLDARRAEVYTLHKEFRTRKAEYEGELLTVQSQQLEGISSAQAELLNQSNMDLSRRLDVERAEHLACKEKSADFRLKAEELSVSLDEQKDLVELLSDGSKASKGAFQVHSRNEFEAKLRQKVVHYNEQVRELRLSEMQLEHKAQVLEARNEFLSSHNHENEMLIAKQQQRLADLESSRMQRDNDMAAKKKSLDAREHRMELVKGLGNLEREREAGANLGEKARLIKHRAIARRQNAQGEHSSGLRLDPDDDLEEGEDQLEGQEGAWWAEGQEGPSIHTQMQQWAAVEKKLRDDVGKAKQVLDAQKRTIEDLKRKNEQLTKNAADYVTQQDNDSELNSAERTRILSTAQDTVRSLHTQLSQKNDAILRYQQMMEKARRKFQAQRELDEVEIERLNEQVVQSGGQHMGKLQSAMSFLSQVPALPQGVVATEELEDRLAVKEQALQEARREAEVLRTKGKQDRAKLGQELRDAVAENVTAKEHGEKLRKDLSESRTAHEAASLELRAVRESMGLGDGSEESVSSGLKGMVGALKKQLGDKESQVNALQDAIAELKEEILSVASESSKAHSVNGVNTELNSAQNRWMIEKQKFLSKLDDLESKLKSARAKKRAGGAGDEEEDQAATKAMTDLIKQQQLAMTQLEAQLSKTKRDSDAYRETVKAKAAAAGGEPESGVSPASAKVSSTKSAKDKDPKQSKVLLKKIDDLKRQVDALQEDNSRLKRRGSSSQELTSATSPRAATAFERWEAEKRLGKQVDTLKSKLTERAQEVAVLRQQNASLSKDKLELLATQPSKKASALGTEAPVERLSEDLFKQLEELELVRAALFDEKNKVSELTKLIEVDHVNTLDKLRAVNRTLTARLAAAEEGQDALDTPRDAQVEKLERIVDELETKLLEANCDKLDMRFTQEQYNEQLSLLRGRVEELAMYKTFASAGGPTASTAAGVIGSPVDADPASKQEEAALQEYPELAKLPAGKRKVVARVVATLRHVIDKLRQENENLKKNAPSNIQYMEVMKSNKKLKTQLASAASVDAGIKDKEASGKLSEATLEQERLGNLLKTTRANLVKEKEAAGRLKKQVLALIQDNEALSTGGQPGAAAATADDRVDAMRLKHEDQEQELEQQRALVDRMKDQMTALNAMIDQVKQQYAQLQERHEQAGGQEEGGAEMEQLRAENEAYKQELGAFDADFFEEIEDLKFRYSESIKASRGLQDKNEQITTTLRKALSGDLRKSQLKSLLDGFEGGDTTS